MKVAELKELLEGVDDDLEVMIVQQPHWPFVYSVQAAATRQDIINYNDVDENETEDKENVFYIIEGQQLRYADGIEARGFEL